MSKRWGKLAGGALIVTPRNRVLLLFRSQYVFDPLIWGIPGGKVERGEVSAIGVSREVEEETRLRPQLLLTPFHVYTEPGFRYETYLGYLPEEVEPRGLNWEHLAYCWATVPEILANPRIVHPNVRAAVAALGQMKEVS